MTATFQLQLAFALCAAAILAMGAPGFWMYRRFLRDLRERHPEEWERLGRPTVVYYSSQSARRALNRWIADAGFERLGDPGFAADCRRYVAYTRVYGALFVGLFILFALVMGARFLADR